MNQIVETLLVSGGPFASESYSDSEGSSWILWLLGPAAGVAFYMAIFFRYRNTNKRHAYERETAVEVVDMRVYDQQVGSVTGVERTSIERPNGSRPRVRLGQGTTVSVAAAAPAEPQVQQESQSQQEGPPADPPAAPPAP